MQYKTTQRNFVAGSSRGTRKATTLLAQMADLERGERIKSLRLQRHLTQPAVADLVGVTLRAYQEWEAGGGIQWENVKRLARLLDVDPEYVMRGDRPSTPDLSRNGASDRLADLEAHLERIEAKLDQVLEDPGPWLKKLWQAAGTIQAAPESPAVEDQPPAQG